MGQVFLFCFVVPAFVPAALKGSVYGQAHATRPYTLQEASLRAETEEDRGLARSPDEKAIFACVYNGLMVK